MPLGCKNAIKYLAEQNDCLILLSVIGIGFLRLVFLEALTQWYTPKKRP